MPESTTFFFMPESTSWIRLLGPFAPMGCHIGPPFSPGVVALILMKTVYFDTTYVGETIYFNATLFAQTIYFDVTFCC